MAKKDEWSGEVIAGALVAAAHIVAAEMADPMRRQSQEWLRVELTAHVASTALQILQHLEEALDLDNDQQ